MDLKIDLNTIMSGLAIVGTVIGYLIHDRKLRKQEAQLNEIQLAKETQPDVVAQLDRGQRCVVVGNYGPVRANDVDVKVSPDIRNMPRDWPFPMNLEARQEVSFSVQLGINAPSKIDVELTWNMGDSSKDVKSRKYTLPTRS